MKSGAALQRRDNHQIRLRRVIDGVIRNDVQTCCRSDRVCGCRHGEQFEWHLVAMVVATRRNHYILKYLPGTCKIDHRRMIRYRDCNLDLARGRGLQWQAVYDRAPHQAWFFP